jgi:hypothetical protein
MRRRGAAVTPVQEAASPPVLRGRDLLRALYADAAGMLNLRAISRDKRWPALDAFCAPSDTKAITTFCTQHQDREVYYGVALRKDATSGKLANCAWLPSLFVDLDSKTFANGEIDARAALARSPLVPTAIVHSGGGLHVYWLLKEPIDLTIEADAAKTWLRRLARALDGDLCSAEPARVLRLPGTRNHKYEHDPLVTIEALDDAHVYALSDFDDWLPADTTSALPIDGVIPEGQRNATLASLAGSMRRRGTTIAGIDAALQAENTARCRPPLAADEVRAIARSIGKKAPAETPVNGGAAHRTVLLTPANTIRVRPVRWLWEGRLALGTLGLLGGREGVGKSTVAYTLIADVTRGRLPGASAGIPRAAIVAATEDSWEYTIAPRLMAAGADLARVYRADVTTIEGTEGSLSLPRDLADLDRLAREVDAVLILLDPLLSRLDKALDTHKDAEVRLALEPLVRLASATDACVLGLIHVNKGTTSDPLTMLMGSRAFAAVARTVLFVMADPEDEDRRLLGTPKNNLGRCDLPTLAFRIVGAKVAETPEGPVWTGKIEWLGETDQTIREAIVAAAENSGDMTARQEAALWLVDYLTSQGGSADSATIKDAGKRAGHTVDALHRARKSARLVIDPVGFPRRTYWRLPSRQSSDPSSVQPSHAVVGCPGETSMTQTTQTTDANRGVGAWSQLSEDLQSFESSEPPRARPTTDAPMLRFEVER